MNAMQQMCDDMQKQVTAVKDQATHLLSESHAIQAEQEALACKDAVTRAFLDRFVLSVHETELLSGQSLNVDDHALSIEFFEVLKRLQTLLADCKLLLMLDKNQAGLAIMESITVIQETAYERLFQWSQVVIHAMSRDVPEITETMRSAVDALKHRSVLLQTLVDDIVGVRRTSVIRCFIDALTRGGRDGNPAPIEVHAHDPIRYTGDMLAWVHQSTCSERECLEQLFDSGDDVVQRRTVLYPKMRPTDVLTSPTTLPNVQELITDMLDHIMEGVCRPLRSRIDQAIRQSSLNITLAYQTANMIQFYARLIQKALVGAPSVSSPQGSMANLSPNYSGSAPQLVSYLDDITQSAFKIFYEVLHQYGTNFVRESIQVSADISPPVILLDAVKNISDLMSSYDSSLIVPLSPTKDSFSQGNFSFQVSSDREAGFAPILSALIDPLVQMCETASIGYTSLLNRTLFLLNCFYELNTTLQIYHLFTKSQLNRIEVQVSLNIEKAEDIEAQEILQRSGLQMILSKIDTHLKSDNSVPLISVVSGEEIHNVLATTFDTLLGSMSMEIANDLRFVTSARHSKDIAVNVLKRVVKSYRSLVLQIMDPTNQYKDPESLILVRTVEEVETVLGVNN